MKKKFNHIAIILFAYNEKNNLNKLLNSLKKNISKCLEYSKLEFCICVQGRDGTLDEALKFKNKNSSNNLQVNIDYSKEPLGIKKAFFSSLNLLNNNADIYITMDCDLNHDPSELNLLTNKIDEESVVIGSRYIKGGSMELPLWKVTLSKLFNYFFSLLLNIKIKDMTSGYRVFRTKKFKKIIRSTKSREFAFYFESLFRFHKNKIKIYEVPIKYHKRLYGQSKMNLFNTMLSYICLIFILIYIFLYEK